MIMTHDKKKHKSLPYGQCLYIFFQHFNIVLTSTDKTLYSKHMKITHKSPTKMRFVLNRDGAQVTKDQVEGHDEKEYDEEEEPHVGGGDNVLSWSIT